MSALCGLVWGRIAASRVIPGGIPGQRHEAWLALEKKYPGRIVRNLEHMDTILKAKPDYIKKKRRPGHKPTSGAAGTCKSP